MKKFSLIYKTCYTRVPSTRLVQYSNINFNFQIGYILIFLNFLLNNFSFLNDLNVKLLMFFLYNNVYGYNPSIPLFIVKNYFFNTVFFILI